MIGEKSNLTKEDNEGEIGYWIGVPFWGKGYIPEATAAVLQYAFEVLKLKTIWCGYYEGNKNSRRVQEKCGFTFHHKEENALVPLLNERRNLYISQLTAKKWQDMNK